MFEEKFVRTSEVNLFLGDCLVRILLHREENENGHFFRV